MCCCCQLSVTGFLSSNVSEFHGLVLPWLMSAALEFHDVPSDDHNCVSVEAQLLRSHVT